MRQRQNACSLPATGLAELRMQLVAGLGGQAVEGRTTEFRLRLQASRATRAELHYRDRNGTTSLSIELPAQRELDLWLPLNPPESSAVEVSLQADNMDAVIRHLNFARASVPLTIITHSVSAYAQGPGYAPQAGIRPVILAPQSLPRTAQAYAAVTAMVTDLASISELSTRQHRAFATYLGACKILLLAGAAPEILAQLRKLAGCGGRFVQVYESLSQVAPLLHTLSTESGFQQPSGSELLALDDPSLRSSTATSLGIFLAGYVVFMALVNWRLQQTRYLLLLPLIAAGAGLLAWSGDGDSRSISWLVAQSGDNHARMASLVLLGGDRRGESRALIGANESLTTNHRGAARIRYLDDQSSRELSTSGDLLRPSIYRLDGVRRQSLPYRLRMQRGIPELAARREAPGERARLLWRGYTYAVPLLTKGETWQPDDQRRQPPRKPEEKLLNRYLDHDSPAVLLPIDPAALADQRNRGWLVIRPEPGGST